MKRISFSILFSLVVLTSYAQTANRIWREGFNLYVADKQGTVAKPYNDAYRTEVVVNGYYLFLRINGVVFNSYLPKDFLSKNGIPYSIESPERALAFFKAGTEDSLLTVNKFTNDIVSDRTTLLMLAPVAQTLKRVYVVSDSKYGNRMTEYLIYPNGDRFLMYSQQEKDN